MGLNSDDPKPAGMSLSEAYTAARQWYRANVKKIESRDDKYSQRSVALIKAMPSVGSLSELEVRAVLGEIIYGSLEWAYHQSDGRYKMAAYAYAAFETAALEYSLSDEERNKLKTSKLWPFLSINRDNAA